MNGRKFIHHYFGPVAGLSIRIHTRFKLFFSCVDPNINTLYQYLHPSWKVRPFLILCVFIFMILNLFISYPTNEKKSGALKKTGRCTIIKGEKFKIPVYWINVIDFYNHNMGNFDLDDKLHNH